jgi:hypothetical protein
MGDEGMSLRRLGLSGAVRMRACHFGKRARGLPEREFERPETILFGWKEMDRGGRFGL